MNHTTIKQIIELCKSTNDDFFNDVIALCEQKERSLNQKESASHLRKMRKQ